MQKPLVIDGMQLKFIKRNSIILFASCYVFPLLAFDVESRLVWKQLNVFY